MNLGFKKLSVHGKVTLVFSLLLLVVLSSYLAIFWYNARQKTEASLIDVAGRNRMLSQRIAAMALLCNSDSEDEFELAKEELRKAVVLHEQSLQALKNGGMAPGVEGDITLSAASPIIMPKILEIEEFFKGIKDISNALQSEPKYIKKEIPRLDSVVTNQPAKIGNPRFFEAINKMKLLLTGGVLLKHNMELVQLYTAHAGETKKAFIGILIVILLLNVMVIGFTFLFLRRLFAPLTPLSKNLTTLSEGLIPSPLRVRSDDEVGEITIAVNRLTVNLGSAVEFAGNVGEGKLDTNIEVFEGRGSLSQAMNKMRDNLRMVGEEDKKRNWASSGLAKFAEILQTNINLKDLGDSIVSNLVKYLNVNQASLFVVNDQDANDVHLELISCYAFDRKKFLHKKIHVGEGLVGQAYLERSTIYLREVPKDYIKITSGLGQANPRTILIVPLKVNDEMQGIIELAAFKELHDFEISFAEKLSENIASMLSSAKGSQRTARLLEASQQQAEALRSQEEEMRQNMEELAATQEQMHRQIDETVKIQKDLLVRENVFAITTILSEADLFGNILLANEKLCEVSKYRRDELIGKPHNIFRHPDMPRELFRVFWTTIKQGQVFRGIIKNRAKDGTHYWVDATIVPVKDEDGKIAKYIGARYHITDDKIAEELYRRQAEKMNLLNHELKLLDELEYSHKLSQFVNFQYPPKRTMTGPTPL